MRQVHDHFYRIETSQDQHHQASRFDAREFFDAEPSDAMGSQ
jgi:hypothetical protein